MSETLTAPIDAAPVAAPPPAEANPFAKFDAAPVAAGNPFAKFDAPVDGASKAPSAWERIAREFATPLFGMAQIANRILPIPGIASAEGADKLARENEQRIELGRDGETGLNWERMGVDVVNPVNYIGGPIAKAVGAAPKVAGPLIGAITTGIQPVTDGGNFAVEKAKQAAIGTVGGKLADSIGGVIAPELTGAAKTLSDQGVRLTPGQSVAGKGVLGDIVRGAEDKFTSLPILGDVIKAGKRVSIEDFNRGLYQQVLAPIGETLPKDVPAGREGIKFIQTKLRDAYDNLLPQLTFTADHQLATDLTSLTQAVGKMAEPQQRQYDAILKNTLLTRLAPTGSMTGLEFKAVESELTQMANGAKSSAIWGERQLGYALDELNHTLRAGLERGNPGQQAELAAANKAYAMLSRVEDASMRRATLDGVFLPSDLLSSVKGASRRTGQRKSFAAGDAMLQDYAEAGQALLPSTIPDSGTAGRSLMAGLGLGGGSYLAGHPAIPIGMAAAALPYTRTGMSAGRAMAQSPNWLRNVGQGAFAPNAAQGLLGTFEELNR